MEEVERALEEIQKALNKTMDETKVNWNELKQHSEQLKRIQEVNDVEFGGIKISDLNNSMTTLASFLQGAFNEVNKSVASMSDSIEDQKKENNKKNG